MICDVDEPVRLEGTFTEPGTETPIPPEKIDKVVCTVKTPSSTETSSPEVDRSEDADGIYWARFFPQTNGRWEWSMDGFDSAGKPIARAEGNFTARKRKVPRD